MSGAGVTDEGRPTRWEPKSLITDLPEARALCSKCLLGVLGFAAEHVSAGEQRMLEQVRAALGVA
jgi:hypothetical protein